MFQLLLGRQQRVERIGLAHGIARARHRLALSAAIQQRACKVARLVVVERGLAVILQRLDLAIHALNSCRTASSARASSAPCAAHPARRRRSTTGGARRVRGRRRPVATARCACRPPRRSGRATSSRMWPGSASGSCRRAGANRRTAARPARRERLRKLRSRFGANSALSAVGSLAARGAQIVQQRQQDDRNVLVPALHAFQIIGQLHHAAHQHASRLRRAA